MTGEFFVVSLASAVESFPIPIMIIPGKTQFIQQWFYFKLVSQVNAISLRNMLRQYMDENEMMTSRRGSRDVNKYTEDPVFSLTYRIRKLKTVIPKMFLFFRVLI